MSILILLLIGLILALLVVIKKEKYTELSFNCDTDCTFKCTNFAPMYGFNGSTQLFNCINACDKFQMDNCVGGPGPGE